MSSDLYQDVRGTYLRFGFIEPGARPPHALDPTVAAERAAFMQEELDEYKTALTVTPTLAAQADALIDLVVVALGTAALMDLPWEALWNEVQRANNAKVRGAGRHHGNRPGADLVKPPGWRGPDLAPILAGVGVGVAPPAPALSDQVRPVGSPCRECVEVPQYTPGVCDRCEAYRRWEDGEALRERAARQRGI